MNTKMKKIIISMAVLLTLALSSCKIIIDTPTSGNETTPQETEFEKIEQVKTEADKIPQEETTPNTVPQETKTPTEKIPDADPTKFLIGEKYYCVDDTSRVITFNQDGTFIYADGYGASTGDYIVNGEIMTIRFHIEDEVEPEVENDSYFTIIDSYNLQEMHGEIYTVESNLPALPAKLGGDGGISQIKWQGIYANNNNGVVIEISQVGVNDFWFDIVQLTDLRDIDFLYGLNSLSEISDDNIGYYIFASGWAQINADNAYFAVFDSYGFSLYENCYAIDIFAGESTDWEHLRGQYMKI